ncbi:BTAD domain-containing putative transcriptional regulator [Streptomyces sp. NPDC005227]|uniref:BTAD domain-containing putative transcriptional regulator n=1 Tax=Streptomyces sp. NPDC005227 TaxID=3364707 RepID=UPI00369B169A
MRPPQDAVDAWRFEEAVRRARTAPPAEARRLLEEALGWWRGAAYGEWADDERRAHVLLPERDAARSCSSSSPSTWSGSACGTGTTGCRCRRYG